MCSAAKSWYSTPFNPVRGFNVHDGIERSTHKEEDIVGIAHMLLSESLRFDTSTGSYFQNQAHNLLTGLLAHVMPSPDYAALVCGNAFKSSDIASGRKDVFLNIPASILRYYPGIGRVISGALINAMVRADGDFRQRALFMLDEVDLLGYMRILEEAHDHGRKYGITLMLMYQSVGQLERHFGKDGANSWIEGYAFTSYAAIKTLDTARNVSAQCGEMTVEVQGRSHNVG